MVNERFDRQMGGLIIKKKRAVVLRPEKNEQKPYMHCYV